MIYPWRWDASTKNWGTPVHHSMYGALWWGGELMTFLSAAYEPHCVTGQNTEMCNEHALISPLVVFLSCQAMSDSLWPHGLQDARLPCPSPSPRVYPNSCPSGWWCHPTISSSVIPFSSHPQSFPASGSFPMCQLFASGGQSFGVSASASVLPMNSPFGGVFVGLVDLILERFLQKSSYKVCASLWIFVGCWLSFMHSSLHLNTTDRSFSPQSSVLGHSCMAIRYSLVCWLE